MLSWVKKKLNCKCILHLNMAMTQLACNRMSREQIGNNICTRVMNCFSAHQRVILIFQKLQCLSDTSILTMIPTCFIYVPGIEVMTIHFSCLISPINCQHFQWSLPVSLSMTPAHPKVGKLEIVTICKVNQKQPHAIFADCILLTIVDILESSVVVLIQ